MTNFSMRTRLRLSFVAAAVLAAGRTATSQTLDRSQRPVAPPGVPAVFPRVETRTLRNGLRVKIVENHSLPIVAVRVLIDVDSLADPVGKEGLYALTMSMLREGTQSR